MTSGAAPGISLNAACCGLVTVTFPAGVGVRLDRPALLGYSLGPLGLRPTCGSCESRRPHHYRIEDRSWPKLGSLTHAAPRGASGRSGRVRSPSCTPRSWAPPSCAPWPSATGSTRATSTTSYGAPPCRWDPRVATSAAWPRSTRATPSPRAASPWTASAGPGISAVNFAAATGLAGMEDVVVAGGTEMMSSYAANTVEGALPLPRQRQRPPAGDPPPDEPGRGRRRHRHPGEDRPPGRRRAGGRVPAPGRDRDQGGALRQVAGAGAPSRRVGGAGP